MKTHPSHPNESLPEWMLWLDDAMTPEQKTSFEARLQADPELQAEIAAYQQISHSIKHALPREIPVPHPELFNSQIQVRIDQESQRSSRAKSAQRAWYQSPWISAAAVAAALAILLLGPDHSPNVGRESIVTSTYTPDPNVTVSALYSDEAEAVVLILDGLSELPADRNLVGSAHPTRPAGSQAGTALYGGLR